ncbi:endolytic transglycosylase MltG [Nonlabens ponticola]|uniref:Endolytic murein transglycosylase n=1 Tax=Nonlabens ponticola TaxID=2496866 RepID=A0A3S9MYB2_9FLAO|nr:endolytic transglycosylase MltG [Nonlabens ponticola]AZQ44129.1 endolytic transglycosylase MltG [Nonlabens ponticola]
MNNYKKIILGVVLLGLVGMAVFAYNVYQTFFGPNTNFTSENYEVLIPTGADYNEAFHIIADAVEDRDAFHNTAVRKGYHKNVKPGRYLLRPGMNNNEIINTVRSVNVPVKLRFNNQERLEDLAGRIAMQIEPDSLSLLMAMQDPTFLKAHGFTRENALAMYLPNQYDTYWNSSATEFRDKMLRQYQAYWNSNRLQKAARLEMTPQEVVTLASIVHKETAKVDERPRVAGVYINRLESGIKLDADPTVIYAKKMADNDFNQVIKRVLYKDLVIDQPYNTYRNAGLPPGPIVTPDLSAIDAVLNHEDHGYYFFVADVENFGYHKFARTLSQHNANAAAYRRWANERKITR